MGDAYWSCAQKLVKLVHDPILSLACAGLDDIAASFGGSIRKAVIVGVEHFRVLAQQLAEGIGNVTGL